MWSKIMGIGFACARKRELLVGLGLVVGFSASTSSKVCLRGHTGTRKCIKPKTPCGCGHKVQNDMPSFVGS